MIRPIFTEVVLFLLPFLAYAIFLWATRSGVLDPRAWAPQRIAWLVIAALVLMVGSFLAFAQFGGAPARSTYVPAHLDAGEVKPGQTKPGETK
jgi:Family of unknown function (DUF6111)